MNADPYPLVKIFGPDIQYVVPIFQRRYVWNEEEQWAELWEDVLDVVDEVERVKALIASGAKQPLPSHFLGAIVCDQSDSSGSDIDERPLIDGQQRLTTLQILIAAAHRIAADAQSEQAVELLQNLVENNDVLVADDHQRFKVWPSNPDRATFAQVMKGEPVDEPDHLIAQAFGYFSSAVSAWSKDGDQGDLLVRLARTLRNHIELVVIDLEAGDNAQVIFESLNYGGRELTALDLVKNLVFFRSVHEGIDPHQLYNSEWEPFDDDWWGEHVSQGRLNRARAELFLMHWLKLEKLEEVKAHRLFVEFRDLPDLDQDLQATVTRLAADRDLYRMADQDPESLSVQAAGFLERLEVLNLSPPRPVVLQILRAVPDRVSPDVAERAFHILDSYLWRRTLTRGTTQNYNRVMLNVLKAVDEDIANADQQILTVLREAGGPAVVWPSDDQLAVHLRSRPIYGSGRVAVATIRTAIRLAENRLRAPKGETPLSAKTELQVEHMMPQSWQAHWPLDPDPEATLPEREQQRNTHVDLLGNLTLVTPGMNQSLSNSEWLVKRGELKKHSTLLISQRYLDEEHWDERSIRGRGDDLIESMIAIWPGPDGDFSQPTANC